MNYGNRSTLFPSYKFQVFFTLLKINIELASPKIEVPRLELSPCNSNEERMRI
jgi:hypothetical protein